MAEERIHNEVRREAIRDDVAGQEGGVVRDRSVVPFYRRISWPAVFGGTMVAIGLELLFTMFGLFVGFRMGPTGGLRWGVVWGLITAFCALGAGGWVAARLGTGEGRLHGAVSWGLTTLASAVLLGWFSWGAVSTALRTVQAGTAVAEATQAITPSPVTPNEASRMANEATTPANVAGAGRMAAQQISRTALYLWLYILIGLGAAILGGTMAGPVITERRVPV